MSEEDLNGAQVCAVFEQVGSKTVAQSVRMDSVLEASLLRSPMAGIPHGPGADGTVGGVMTPARESPEFGLALESAEVVAQGFQQRSTEHDIAILATFSPADVDHHAVAVDIGDLQLA